MFAQLFGAAKRAISRSPSYQGRSSEAPPEIPEVPTSDPAPQDTADTTTHTTVAMVTTRRGTETPGMASTPASSAKKIGKRELDALETPTPTQVKRQRKTTVEVKRTLRSTPRKDDAESTQEDDDEAEDDTAGGNTSPLAIRRRSSPKVLVEPSSPVKEDAHAEDGFHTPEPASSEAAFVTPFTSKKALAGSPTPKAPQTDDTPAAAKKARGRPKKTQKEDVNMPEEIPSSTQESSIASPAADAPAQPKAHVRFGSEEPTANLKGHTRYEAPAPAAAEQHDDESASDSDEAPEMVTTSAAASKAASLAADASRAQAAQSEKELKKRSAREKRIAEEQAAKRERDALKAKKAAARAAKAARLSSVAEEAQSDEEEDTAPALNRAALPSLLPDSLLANLDAVRPPTPPPEARGRTQEELRREKLNHHIKFLEQSSKAPKDRRVGKHHVAVLGQQSKKMAAKVSRNTKGVRESWLKGRQGQVAKGKPRIGKTHRAKFGGGGFLRGED